MRPRTKLIAALLLLAAIIGWPIIAHYRLKNKVVEFRRQLAAQGEKLKLLNLIPPLPPDDDNAGPALLAAVRQVEIRTGNWKNQPPDMRMVLPGRALVAWQQAILPTSESTNIWPALRNDLEANRDALTDIRAALEKPHIAFAPDYSQGVTMSLAHLAPLRRTAQWLLAEATFELHEGRVTNAVENLQAISVLVSRYKAEPVMISSLVRMAIAFITVNTIWEALQSPDLSEEQLADLQSKWRAMDFLSQVETGLMMDRVSMEKVFADARESADYVVGASQQSTLSELAELGQGLLNDPRGGFKQILHRYPGYWAWKWWWSYDDELAEMKFVQTALDAVRTIRKEQRFGSALETFERANGKIRNAYPNAGSWFGMGLGDSYPNYLFRLRNMEIQRHLLVTAIALKRFHLRHGHYPDSLATLSPEICREIPHDPVDGQPLRYRLQADGSFLLYSIGENVMDDGGDPSRPPNQKSRQWIKGLDAVWPQAASNQEILLYELETEGDRDKDGIRSRVIVTNDLSAAMLAELRRLAETYHFALTNNAHPRR